MQRHAPCTANVRQECAHHQQSLPYLKEEQLQCHYILGCELGAMTKEQESCIDNPHQPEGIQNHEWGSTLNHAFENKVVLEGSSYPSY